MTINYTALLGLAKPVEGTEENTWGAIVNDRITQLIEDAVSGIVTVSVLLGDVTLTSNTGQTDQARMAIIVATGTPGVARNIIAPSSSKIYQLINQSDSTVTLKGAATTGVAVPAGASATIAWNGSDFVEITKVSSSKTIRGNLSIEGNTTIGVASTDILTVNATATFNQATKVAAGTAAAPSISPTGDTNTGLYFPAADQVAISTGGAQRVIVDASGNVGVGVTPSAWGSNFKAIQVAGSSVASNGPNRIELSTASYVNQSGEYIYSQSGVPVGLSQNSLGVHRWYSAPAGTAGSTIPFGDPKMTLDASGNLLVNTATSFAGAVNGTLQVQGSYGGQLFLRHTASASNKNWRIGPDGSANNIVIYNQSGVGVYMNDGGTSWISSSDERLKTSLTPIENAIKKVCSIRAVTGRYLADDESVSRAFFIAQDFEKHFPEPVSKQNNELNTLGLSYTETIPLAFAAIQEQQALIEKQQALIEALTARIAALEAK